MIRVGNYYIFSQNHKNHGDEFSKNGIPGLNLSYFISDSNVPRICFRVSICRLMLRYLDETSARDILSNQLVVLAPSGLIATLEDLNDFGSPTDRDFILEKWRYYHGIEDDTIVSVNVGNKILKVPRKSVFLLHPATQYKPNAPESLNFTNLKDAHSLDPMQFFSEVYRHQFGPSNSVSLTNDHTAFTVMEMLDYVMSGNIMVPKPVSVKPDIISDYHDDKKRDREQTPTEISPDLMMNKRIKVKESVEQEDSPSDVLTFQEPEKADMGDLTNIDDLEQWIYYMDKGTDTMMSIQAPTETELVNGEPAKPKSTSQSFQEKNIASTGLEKPSYNDWTCPTDYKTLNFAQHVFTIQYPYEPTEKKKTSDILPFIIENNIGSDKYMDMDNYDDGSETDESDSNDDEQYYTPTYSATFSQDVNHKNLYPSPVAHFHKDQQTTVHRIMNQNVMDSAKKFYVVTMLNFLHPDGMIPNYAAIEFNNEYWLKLEIFNPNHMLPAASTPANRDKESKGTDDLLCIIEQEALNKYSSIPYCDETPNVFDTTGSQHMGLDYWMVSQSNIQKEFLTPNTPKSNSNESSDNPVHSIVASWTSLLSGNECNLEDWLIKMNGNAETKELATKMASWGGSFLDSRSGDWPSQDHITYFDWQYVLNFLSSTVLKNILKESIHGPLDIEEYQRIISETNLSDHQSRKRLKGEKGSRCEMESFSPPRAIVRYEQCNIDISINALYLWEKLDISPFASAKKIKYFVITPDVKSSKLYFKQLSSIYRHCNLGEHIPHENVSFLKVDFPITPYEESLALDRAVYNIENANGYNVYKISETILNEYKQACQTIVNILRPKNSYIYSVVIYIVNPYSQDHILPISPGGSIVGKNQSMGGTGLSKTQLTESQKSYYTLLRQCMSSLEPIKDMNFVLHGILYSHIVNLCTTSSHFKEVAFNVFHKVRRVSMESLSNEKPDDQPTPRLYEPPFVISNSYPYPVEDISAFFQSDGSIFTSKHMDMSVIRRDDEVLHVVYSLSNGFANVCLVDCYGEFLETKVLEQFRITMYDLSVLFYRILKTTSKAFQYSIRQGKVVIGKMGHLTSEELNEWRSVINDVLSNTRSPPPFSEIALVSLTLTDDFKLLPKDPREILNPRKEEKLNSSQRVNNRPHGQPKVPLEKKYTDSLFFDGYVQEFDGTNTFDIDIRCKTLAMYHFGENMTDEKGLPILCRSLTYNNYPMAHNASLYSVRQTSVLNLNMYIHDSLGGGIGKSDHELFMKDISRQNYQLSWLNVIPVSPQRMDILPIHYRIVKRLTAMSNLMCK